jgi:hypothetical protein
MVSNTDTAENRRRRDEPVETARSSCGGRRHRTGRTVCTSSTRWAATPARATLCLTAGCRECHEVLKTGLAPRPERPHEPTTASRPRDDCSPARRPGTSSCERVRSIDCGYRPRTAGTGGTDGSRSTASNRRLPIR